MSESTAHNLFNYWQKIFQEALPPSLLEQVKKFPEEVEQIKEELTKYELIVDSSEQVIERPLAVGHATRTDYQSQKKYYSGKQKRCSAVLGRQRGLGEAARSWGFPP